MKIFIDQNSILTESKKTSNKDLDPRVKFIENIREEIFNSEKFRKEFYSNTIPDDAKISNYIECKHSNSENRYEIRFRDPITSNKIMLNSQRKELLQEILKEINENIRTSLYISNDKDQYIINTLGFYITSNPHLTILDNHLIQQNFKFVIKFDREAKKDTWFKEGIKIQIINYMIKINSKRAQEAICSQETFNAFKDYVNKLFKDKQNPRRGMKSDDFNKIYNFIDGCLLTGGNECFGMLDIINKYHTSCDAIAGLAKSTASFVTNDESENGYLRRFKSEIKNLQDKTSTYIKQHPADLLLIGSKFNQNIPLLPELDNTYCAISLKEEDARLGKVSNYILGLKCKYTPIAEQTGENKVIKGNVKEIRDHYLSNDIEKFLSSNNLNLDTFEQMCNKYSVALPVSNRTQFYNVTCNNIENKENINFERLNINALYNLFFTAVISSYSNNNIYEIENQKTLLAKLINESLQIGDYGYYLTKDSYDLSRVDKSLKLDASNIENFEIKYTGHISNAVKKVTNVSIIVKFSNPKILNNGGNPKIIQLDIRQNKNDSHNSVLELK